MSEEKNNFDNLFGAEENKTEAPKKKVNRIVFDREDEADFQARRAQVKKKSLFDTVIPDPTEEKPRVPSAEKKAAAEAKRKAAEAKKAANEAKRQAFDEKRKAAGDKLKAAVAEKRKAMDEKRKAAEEKKAAEAEEKRIAAEEAERKAEEEARLKADEAERKAAEEAKLKAEEEAKRRADEELQRIADEKAERLAKEEAERKAAEEARQKAIQEQMQRAEAERKRRAEEEAKRKAVEEAQRKATEEAARRRAEEEAKLVAAIEAQHLADEEEARRKAAEESLRAADEEAQRRAAEKQAERKASKSRKQRKEEKRKAEAAKKARPTGAPVAAPAVAEEAAAILAVEESAKEIAAPKEDKKPSKKEIKAEKKAQSQDKKDKVSKNTEKGDYKPVVTKRKKGNGCLSGLLFFIFVVSVSVILACLAWMAATDVLALNAPDVTETITLPKSAFDYDQHKEKNSEGKEVTVKTHTADIDYVAKELKDAGIINYKWLFKLYCAFTHASDKLDPGTYELQAAYDYRALVMKMQAGSGSMVTSKITFPEGYNMRQIFAKLDEEGVCEYDDLMNAAANASFTYSFLEGVEPGDASRIEGFLFPDTYEFYEGMPASSAINKLLEGFYYKFTAEMLEWVEQSGYSMKEIVTIASMIEKEAANDDERAIIASVIYNRLNMGWPLQVDSTTLYEYPDHEGAPTKEMLEKDTPYNTRINTGLPPTPICSPGLPSIKAALQPASTSYMFYALDSDTGTHKFFASADEFNAFVATQTYD